MSFILISSLVSGFQLVIILNVEKIVVVRTIVSVIKAVVILSVIEREQEILY